MGQTLEAVMEEMYIPKGRKPTQKAIIACARFISRMLEIGWKREDIPELERMWWLVRDDRGNVSGPAPAKPEEK